MTTNCTKKCKMYFGDTQLQMCRKSNRECIDMKKYLVVGPLPLILLTSKTYKLGQVSFLQLETHILITNLKQIIILQLFSIFEGFLEVNNWGNMENTLI